MSGSTAPERNWALGDGEATAFTRLPYTSVPGGATTFPASTARPTPPRIFPRRLQSAGGNRERTAASMFPNRNNRLSLQNGPNDKGKTPLRGDSLGNGDSHSMNDHPFATYDRVRSSPVSSTFHDNDSRPRRSRAGLISAASDALSSKFGRKTRPILRQAPMPIILPDVIEISAPPPDYEVEERNRLREMAAQAIGISPFIVHPDSYSQEESTEDEDDIALRTPVDTSELRRFGDTRNSESTPDIRNKSFLDTSSINTANPMRYRSGSVVSHSRHNSIALCPIPAFPTNVLSLNPFLACSGYFPKYTQPSSLRRFALASKNWKTRYIILSMPSNPLSRNTAPAVSYLHLFKSSGPDDKELERLEIHTDSAVFVADEEIGGRRNVLRIKGFEVVSGKGTSNGMHEVTWHLHIIDPVESHKWVSTIKSAILGQRTIAAGLGIPLTPTGPEPRGDLDVIMKMRAQGLATCKTPTGTSFDHQPPRSPTDPNNYASSISSQSIRSQVTPPKPAPSGTVSALKCLFSSRPRSSSRATSFSLDAERQQSEHDHTDDSFTSRGSNLLGMLRSNTPDIQSNFMPANTPIAQRNTLPFTPYVAPSTHRTDRKVLSERQPEQWVSPTTLATSEKNRSSRAMSLGALSLQPPPRKRWASLRPTSGNPHDEIGFRLLNTELAVTTAFDSRPSTEKAETEPPSSPVDFTSFSSMTSYDERPRAVSIQSTSTYGSENTKRSNSSTKRTSKRWSRQLPQRLTPPSGPPPAIPSSSSATQLNVHPDGSDRPPSVISTTSGQSHQSVVTGLPGFSKRASTSSVNSSSTAHNSVSSSSPNRLHRASMPPPPRPAPTTALPMAPDQDSTPGSVPAPSKTSFRNSMAQRAMRLSMIAPNPPPSTNLPPRPDEHEFTVHNNKKNHRRSSSSARSQTILDTIPEPSKHPESPFPPPVGPLPPPPGTNDDPNAPAQPSSRRSSIKQRLRILSSPSPTQHSIPLPSPTPQAFSSRPIPSTSSTPTATPHLLQLTPHASPPTPTSENTPMIYNHDQQSFLQLNTTPTPANQMMSSRIFGQYEDEPEMEELLDDVTPLGPPPRRASKQIVVIPVEPAVSVSPATTLTEDTILSSPASDMMLSRSDSASTDDQPEDEEVPQPVRVGVEAAADGMSMAYSAPSLKETTPSSSDPLRVFSLSPPGSVVSLSLVSL